jgi:outer membrane protein
MNNKVFKYLAALLASSILALTAAAQTPRILVVDMAELYDNHYKTEEQNVRLRGDEQRAQEELERLNAEGNELVEQYRELVDQSRNPALSADAKNRVEQQAQAKLEEIQRKQNEVQNFRMNTQRSLQQRVQNFRDILLEEISKVAVEEAQRRGAQLLLDKSGPSLIGIPAVLYSDDSFDITAAVLAEINKGRPASTARPAPAASGDDVPSITFPGAGR